MVFANGIATMAKGAVIGLFYGLFSVLLAMDIFGMGFYSGEVYYQYGVASEIARWTLGLPLFIAMRFCDYPFVVVFALYLGAGIGAMAAVILKLIKTRKWREKERS